MSTPLRRIGLAIISFGFDPRRMVYSAKYLIHYLYDIIRWTAIVSREDNKLFPFKLSPILADANMPSGVAVGHYFHQDLWAARLVYSSNPIRHIDVGSRIDGFVAHLLCFRNVEVLDIRDLNSAIKGLSFKKADLMATMPLDIEPSDSVSCLHALEHFGLGRYGDPIDPGGWRKGLLRLSEMVAVGGLLYLSVPIGNPRVEFNAHRIFAPSHIPNEAFLLGLELLSFSYVDDNGELNDNVDLSTGFSSIESKQMNWGCGFYLFRKSLEAN